MHTFTLETAYLQSLKYNYIIVNLLFKLQTYLTCVCMIQQVQKFDS